MIRARLHLQGSGLYPRTLGLLAGLGLLVLASVPTYAQFIGTNEVPDLPASAGGAGQPDPFTGAMTYRLPLKVLPGRHGMQPDLALVYRSSNPHDPAGHGWTLELGMIARNTRLSADNNTFWTNDLYTVRLGGVTQDLVRTNPGSTPAEYRTVIEGPFTRFRRIPGADGKDYWEATDRLGRIARFGGSSNARVPGANLNLVYEWMLDRIEDPQGNSLQATYTGADPNPSGSNYKAYLTQITYAGTRTITVYHNEMDADSYSVHFPNPTCCGHVDLTTSGRRYTTIAVKEAGTLVRAYVLTQSGAPKLLTQVQEYGKDAQIQPDGTITTGTALPPVTFTYTTAADPGGADRLKTVTTGLGGVTTLTYQAVALTAPSDPYTAVVTKTVTVSDGRGTMGTTTYDYTGGVYKASAREFRGFAHTTITGPGAAPSDQRVTDLWFLQGNGLGGSGGGGDDATVATSVMRGKPYRVTVRDATTPTPTVLSDTTTTYQGPIVISNSASSFNPPQQVDVSFPSTGRTTRIVSTYDPTYGNVTREEQFGDLSVPTDDRTLVRTFASPNPTKWIVGLPASEEVYAGTNLGTPPPIGNRKSATYFCYDGATPCDGTPQASPTVGNLTTVGQRLNPTSSGSTSVVTTTMAYDTYGNLTSLKDANSANNERTFLYDSTATYLLRANHPQLPVTAYKNSICRYHVDTTYYGVTKSGNPGSATTPCTNPAQEQVLPNDPGLPSSTGFYGQPALVRDENDKDTTFQYDAVGRETSRTRPDGSKTITQYLQFGDLNNQRIRREDYDMNGTTLLRVTETFFDGLQRTYKTHTTGPDGKTIVTQTVFDTRGNVASRTLPAFSGDPVRTQTFAYDAWGRLLQTTNPDGSTAKACYQDWNTVTVDANGHVRREERDAFGRVVTVKEYTGATDTCVTNPSSPNSLYATTTYEYDVLDNLTKVKDAQNNETTMSYDGASRRTQLADPDTGTTGAVYHPAGQLQTQTDAKTQTIRLTQLDRWSRPFQKDYGTSDKSLYNGDVTYQYDEENRNGYGRVTTVCQGACSGTTNTKVGLFYDVLGRLSRTDETVTVGSTTTYPTQFAYDGLGRLKTVTYPDSSIVTYNYNGPFLASVTEGATTYASFANYNALGQPGTVAFGNNVQTALTYHDQNFRLLRRRTTQGPNTYQDMRYGYDPGGNVTAIVDPLFGPQSFRYDDLDRLISATGPYSPQATRMFGYDKIGNLTLHCTLGDLAYPTSGVGSVRPHAVCATGATSCASPTYQYDANGNLTSNPALSSLLYDFENRPTSITKSGVTTTMAYHDLLGRVTKTASGSTTTYIGPFYECTGGTCTKYVFAGDLRVAMKSGTTVTYFHGDHLGSSSVLSKGSDGTKDQQITYYPFGETRTLTDGSGNPISPGVPYKYTDQELDPSTGLYFYQARYYDPVLGRFVQPDPIVPDLFDPQAVNPYSYVLNNPLRYTDPSGLQAVPGDPGFIGPLQPPILLPEIVIYAAQNPALYTFSNITTSTNPATFSFAPGSATSTQPPPQPGITPYRPAAFPLATTGERVQQSLQLFGSFGGPPVVTGISQLGRVGTLFERLFQPVLRLVGRESTIITNPVPGTLARVIPGTGPFKTLGPPRAIDVYVTAAEDIARLNAKELAKALAIDPSEVFTVIKLPTPLSGLASPIRRLDVGFVGGGRTAGGAREFVVPNQPFPPGSIIEIVK